MCNTTSIFKPFDNCKIKCHILNCHFHFWILSVKVFFFLFSILETSDNQHVCDVANQHMTSCQPISVVRRDRHSSSRRWCCDTDRSRALEPAYIHWRLKHSNNVSYTEHIPISLSCRIHNTIVHVYIQTGSLGHPGSVRWQHFVAPHICLKHWCSANVRTKVDLP
jgi:hypothetical protein